MLTGNTLIFDIETVPDTDGASRIWDLSGISDDERFKAMKTKRLEKTGYSDFIAHHLHRIVAISAALRSADNFRVWSIGDVESTEKELLERFFHGIEKYNPTLVSWNGGGFDLPVIHYRSLLHSVSAPRYWDIGEIDRTFRYNNFINRFHWRHIDLMDVISGFQLRSSASLHEIAALLGFPGKLGMKGSDVWQAYQNGQLNEIRNYCETDVLNTYLIYLRFERVRGKLTDDELRVEEERVQNALSTDASTHLNEFLRNWQSLKH